jgi:hypothetical protein
MYNFKRGDLIAKKYNNIFLKVGVVIRGDESTFCVKWTSYNKDFFLEKEDNVFNELNNLYLLSLQSVHRKNQSADLFLISSS